MGINVLPLIDHQTDHWEIGIGWKKDGYVSHATWIQFLQTRLEQLETGKTMK